MEKETLLEIDDLTVNLRQEHKNLPLVKGVGFSISKGEILGILGESGSGKTLSVSSIIGLNRDTPGLITRGKIDFKGTNLLSLTNSQLNKIRGTEIAYIFQDPVASLNPYRRVGSQVKEVLLAHRLPVDHAQVLKIMRDVGLENAEQIYHMYPFQLSGGQCQRIVIAMAIICQPDLLIADEPISAIDASLQKRILGLLQAINTGIGTSIIIITHDFAVVRFLCHKVVVMYAGMVMEQGTIEEVLGNPMHPYTQELRKCAESLADNQLSLYTLQGKAPSPMDAPSGCVFYERCKQADDTCRESLPELIAIEGEHRVRCKQVAHE